MDCASVRINRAPVLTLWATVVAERLGFDHDESLTLGRAVAGLSAQAKGKRLRLFQPSPEGIRKAREEKAGSLVVEIMHRQVAVAVTPKGIRATAKGKVVNPASVEKYLAGKFGVHLEPVTRAMAELAKTYSVERLAEVAFTLYEKFRPTVPQGAEGWGAKGILELSAIKNAGQ